MNLIPVLCLLLQVSILNANPVGSNQYFSTLAEKCSVISVSILQTSMMRYGVFKKCTNWTEIDNTKNLTLDTEDNVRCLLYFDSLVSFCRELKMANISGVKPDVLMPDLKNYKADNFCKNQTLFPTHKKFDHNISQLVNNERFCDKLCTTYDNTISIECSLAHYFANFNVTTLLHKEQTNVTGGSQPKLLNMAHLSRTAASAQVGPSENSKLQGGESQGNVPPLRTGENQKASNASLHAGNDKSSTNEKHPKVENKKLATDQEVALGTEEIEAPPFEKSAALPVKNQAASVDKNTADVIDKNAPGHKKNDVGQNNPEENGQYQFQTDAELSDGNEEKALNPAFEEDNMKTNLDDGLLDNANDEKTDDTKGKVGEVVGEVEAKATNNKKPNEVIGDKHEQKEDEGKPVIESAVNENTAELTDDSYFFSYFTVICVLFILGYVGYHNRQKVLALVLEGKRGKRQYRGRRPNSANYHKLDSNLEEAISSTCTKNSSHVIY